MGQTAQALMELVCYEQKEKAHARSTLLYNDTQRVFTTQFVRHFVRNPLPEVISCQEIYFVHSSFARSSPYNVRGSLLKDAYICSSDLLAITDNHATDHV